MDIEAVASLCAKECVRQHVGLDRVGYLINAYVLAHRLRNCRILPTLNDCLAIARLVEPRDADGFRRMPAVFDQGVEATASSAIPESMDRLFLHAEGADPAEWTKAFLRIHPFGDGNGRTAFLLYNWVGNTLDHPVPLPDFFLEPDKEAGMRWHSSRDTLSDSFAG